MSESTEPWVEKYRPNTLEDIVLDSVNSTIIQNIIKTHKEHIKKVYETH